jgi:xanthine phosphoribosyltransferase
MKLLQDRISAEGVVAPGGVLKVDNFLNHNVDCELLCELAREWKKLFAGEEITKILTIEASGIAPAVAAGIEFKLPVIYAKRHLSSVKNDDVYSAKVVSFTHGSSYTATVSKKYLNETDKVLIIDDFLANGSAMKAMVNICRESGANIVGIGVAIEKTFLRGGEYLRAQGYRVESLAKISALHEDGSIEFC